MEGTCSHCTILGLSREWIQHGTGKVVLLFTSRHGVMSQDTLKFYQLYGENPQSKTFVLEGGKM